MGKKFQLQIPTPCHQDWATMRPEEQGRFCGSCCKTVVDFTGMSDREMIAYMARAGQGLCGRFDPGQLSRNYSLRPDPPRKRWIAWPLLLTGMLFFTRVPAQNRAIKGKVFVGKTKPEPGQDSQPILRTDSFKILPPVVVTAYAVQRCTGVAGAISSVSITTVDTLAEWLIDTVKTSLAVLGIYRQKELNVYPNPVSRGNAVSLSWQTEAGTYQVQLFNVAGALVQQRTLEVGDKEQVDLMDFPPAIAAGVYVIRAARAGGNGKVYTRKLVVR